MVRKLVLAVVVGVAFALVAMLIGYVLVHLGAGDIGAFIIRYAGLLGLLAGVWYFFTGASLL